MRILVLASRLPYPPNRGDRLRAFNFIRVLAQEHELTLASFIADESEREYVKALRAYCKQVQVLLLRPLSSGVSALVNLWRREPLQALYYRSGAMRRLIGRLLTESSFDAIYVHLFRMAPYVEGWTRAYRVVDLTDVISVEIGLSLPFRSPIWRLVYGIEGRRIERYERQVASAFEETWLISRADREVLSGKCPGANVQIVTNGVDVERFFPTGQSYEPHRLIFVGHMGVFHNVDAATYLVQQALPEVRKRVPDCTLEIVGAEPAPEVMRLGAEPGVTVRGFVPDLNECLNGSSVFVAPLRFAAGVQNKVLEAMAAERPVVTTSIFNSGLGAVPDEQLLVADDPKSLSDHIVSLLQDGEKRRRMGEAGRRFVQENFRWEGVLDRVREIEQKLEAVEQRAGSREVCCT